MKIALVYDRVNKWGGAERILLALHRTFPAAHLFTSVYDRKKAPWAKVFRVHTSFLQDIPYARSHHEFFAPLMPLAFTSFSFKKYDLVISVTSEFAKAVKVVYPTKHICICLTPTRYLWSGYHEYFPNTFLRTVTKPIIMALRLVDLWISKNPNMYIAISEEVRRRIKKYYKKDSIVVYPPLVKLPKIKKDNFFESGYFLVVARLSRFTTYKRVDLAVKAATQLDASLIVVGGGDEAYYKRYSGPTVHFVGKVTDRQLAKYYAHAKAIIFPGKEDFGLTMVEALSFGKPVIAYKAGGALEIITPGKTGIFFTHQTAASLVEVLKKFSSNDYNKNTLFASSKRFEEKIFIKQIKKIAASITKI